MFIVCADLLQQSYDALERKHPPAMHRTKTEKKIAQVECIVMVWPEIQSRVESEKISQVRVHIFRVLDAMQF